ncbi:MAG TPA: cupin domain-containing protein [Xanthobacteraceae bacterium]|jgi:hypothetical protein
MSHLVVTANPAIVELVPSPFPSEWVLEGRPQARATAIARSSDGAMTVIAWSCTKGRFQWKYSVDEMVHILSGEVFITDQSGTERRLGPGDTAFFPAGSTSIWRVTQDVRKVAVCHVAVPKLVSFGLRAWNKLWRIASELLGFDAEAGAANGGLVAEERRSAPQGQPASAAPPG